MKFSVHNHSLNIDLDEIFREMSYEEKKQFIESMSIQDDVIKMVTDYICDESESGAWTSASMQMRQEILERIENKQISALKKGSNYGWGVWREATQALKNIRCAQHVYWAFYHDQIFNDHFGWDVINKFFERNKIESNYTTKEADEDIKRVENIIREALVKMEKK